MRKILLLSSILCCSLLAQAQIPFWLPSSGLVGWYPFDSNANDKSGKGNHGTGYNVTLAQDRLGNNGKAYSFNGFSSYIEVPDHPSLRVKKITLAVWVKPYTISGGVNNVIEKGNKTNAYNETIGMTTHEFAIKQNSGCTPGTNWQINGYNKALQLNDWQLLLSTFDGDTIKSYINDTLVAKRAAPGLMDTCMGGTLRFSYNFDVYPEFFDGVLDDVSMYDRALNECEIRRVYRQNHTGIATQPVNTSPVNSTAKFSIVAPGTGLSYQWLEISGSSITLLGNGGKYSGVNTNTLSITGVTPSMYGKFYKCIVMAPGLCPDSSASAKLEESTFIKDVNNPDLSVYPNPATSLLTIKSDALKAGINYCVIDKLGRKVISGTTTGQENNISVQILPAGLYFLQLQGTNMSARFVKQ
jgi:hypothetical protein